jgi:hypothetical protein
MSGQCAAERERCARLARIVIDGWDVMYEKCPDNMDMSVSIDHVIAVSCQLWRQIVEGTEPPIDDKTTE